VDSVFTAGFMQLSRKLEAEKLNDAVGSCLSEIPQEEQGYNHAL
jgi:hypothetical protein